MNCRASRASRCAKNECSRLSPAGVAARTSAFPPAFLTENMPFIRCTKSRRLAPLVERYLSDQACRRLIAPSARRRARCLSSSNMVSDGPSFRRCVSVISASRPTGSHLSNCRRRSAPRSIYLVAFSDKLLDLPQRMAEHARHAIADAIATWRLRPGCELLAESVSVRDEAKPAFARLHGRGGAKGRSHLRSASQPVCVASIGWFKSRAEEIGACHGVVFRRA